MSPTNVQAASGDTQADVSWTAPTLAIEGTTSYTVTAYRAADDSVATSATTTSTAVAVPGLRNGTPVYFRVVATNLILDGPASAPSNTVTPAGPPFAPENLVATRGDGQITVVWDPPSDRADGTPGDNGDAIIGYQVLTYRADDNTLASTTDVIGGPATVDGLQNGTSYYAEVRAINSVDIGDPSGRSNIVTPAGPPFAPVNVFATAIDGQAHVTWDPPPSRPDGTPGDNGAPISTYTVTSSEGHLATVGAGTTNADLFELSNGTAYTFTVTASSTAGQGLPSSPSNSVVPSGVPHRPENVTATLGGDSLIVSWSPPPVQPDGTPGDNGSAIIDYFVTVYPGGLTYDLGDVATSVDVGGIVEAGTAYSFVIRAVNAKGASPPSAPSNSVTPECTEQASSVGYAAATAWPLECNPSLIFECNNGEDDDGDGQIDYPNDNDCTSSDDDTESAGPPDPPAEPECRNGLDDDGDGFVDFGPDPGCESADDEQEHRAGDALVAQLTSEIEAGDHPFGTTDDCIVAGTDVDCPGESVTISIPSTSPSCSEPLPGESPICHVTVHERLGPVAEALMAEIDVRDLEYLLTYVGGRNERLCNSGQTGQPIPGCISRHSLGQAIDIRPLADNSPTVWNGLVDSDPRIGELIELWGSFAFRWGGNFADNVDPQHFEFVGLTQSRVDLILSRRRAYHVQSG